MTDHAPSIPANPEPRRAPFRIERIGERFELVHIVGNVVDRYQISALDLLTLKQDANAACDGLVFNVIARG